MGSWKDMVLYEAAKKCPHCNKMDSLKRIVYEDNHRKIEFICDDCKSEFVYKNNWSYFLSYAIALLVAEMLYLLVLSKTGMKTAYVAIILLIVMIILREGLAFFFFSVFGACRMTSKKAKK